MRRPKNRTSKAHRDVPRLGDTAFIMFADRSAEVRQGKSLYL